MSVQYNDCSTVIVSHSKLYQTHWRKSQQQTRCGEGGGEGVVILDIVQEMIDRTETGTEEDKDGSDTGLETEVAGMVDIC